MSSPLLDTFLSSDAYNSLPLITEVQHVPSKHAEDLADLQDLLAKHNVHNSFGIRLIHKHFDTTNSEVMVLRAVPVSTQISPMIMEPLIPTHDKQWQGIHYYVDDNGSLQAYEYSDFEISDTSNMEPFLCEFASMVSTRGLQRKFGLKLLNQDNTDCQLAYTEFEVPAKRSTIMIPEGLPMPELSGDCVSVITQWGSSGGDSKPKPNTCRHGGGV